MVGLVAYGWRALGQNPTPPSSASPPKGVPLEGARNNDLAANPDALKADQARIEYEQDALEKRVAMLQTQLGWVLAAVGLFTLIQGAFAAFGAYNFVQQADRIMADMKDRQKAAIEQLNEHSRQMTERGETAVKKIESLALDVRARYPMFDRAEQARREAFESLSRSENGDWREGLYEQLGVRERQRLLSVENFVGLEFLGEGGDIAGNLRLMGNFYASKYVSEGRTNPTDLDRAQYYLELALASTERAFHHLNDYGLLHLEIMKPAKPEIAELQFMESRRKRRQHQRAAYNLASIAHERGNAAAESADRLRHYLNAHDLLKEALGYDVWEWTKSIEREGDIHYNLACCLARLSECEGSADAQKRLTETLTELEAAARIGSTRPKTLTYDLNDGKGDLVALSRCPDEPTQKELSRIRALFESVWSKKGVPV